MYDMFPVTENMMRIALFWMDTIYLRDIAVDYDSKLVNNILELDV